MSSLVPHEALPNFRVRGDQLLVIVLNKMLSQKLIRWVDVLGSTVSGRLVGRAALLEVWHEQMLGTLDWLT